MNNHQICYEKTKKYVFQASYTNQILKYSFESRNEPFFTFILKYGVKYLEEKKRF